METRQGPRIGPEGSNMDVTHAASEEIRGGTPRPAWALLPCLGWGLAPGLMMGLALLAQGQPARWERVTIPDGAIWQDPDWATGADLHTPKAPVLASDRGGRLYFSNGPRVHSGSEGGTRWKTLVKDDAPPGFPRRPLASGGESTVMWGAFRSRDGGSTWDSSAMNSWTSALAVLGDGTRLLGTSYDAIERSPSSTTAWNRVHFGNTFGHIREFAVGGSGFVFALPAYDGLLQSRDSGKSWEEWSHSLHKPLLNGRNIRAMEMGNASGTPLWMAMKREGSEQGNWLVRLHVFFPGIDTVRGDLPDSAITALQSTRDGALWLGTRGQGVFVSRDQGSTFTAMNEGLGSLYVQSIEATSDQRLFALTRDGLFRLGAPTGLDRRTHLAPRPAGSRAHLHLPGLHGRTVPSGGGPSQARHSVLADGRVVIDPGPLTAPSTRTSR